MAITILADTLEGGLGHLRTVGDLNRSQMAEARIKVTFDSSYPTGGEAIDLSNYFSSIVGMWMITDQLTYNVVYDGTNDKLVVYARATDSEVADTTDLSAISVWMGVLGYR